MKKLISTILFSVFIFAPAFVMFAHLEDGSVDLNNSASWGNMMNNMMNFGGMPFGVFGWMGFVMVILWLVFWVIIIIGAIALLKWLFTKIRGGDGEQKSALNILKERYAKGDLTKAEFEERKKDIEK